MATRIPPKNNYVVWSDHSGFVASFQNKKLASARAQFETEDPSSFGLGPYSVLTYALVDPPPVARGRIRGRTRS